MNNADIITIELGRKGKVTNEGSMNLEVQSFAGNHPTVDKIMGISPKGDLRIQRIQPASSPRSGGGNGHDYYSLDDGIYSINDILSTGSYRYRTFVVLNGSELDEYSRDDLDEVLTEHFAGDMAVAKEAQRVHKERLVIAQEVLAEIAEERKGLAEPVTDGDMTAFPEFSDLPYFCDQPESNDLPTAEQVVRDMSVEGFDRLDYIMKKAAPRQFVVHAPVFARARTPEQVFAKARTLFEDRKAQLVEAQGKAEEAGWPALKGSEKQIKWAETIRAKVATKDPKAKTLKTAKTAKYWIDNHRFA